MHPGKNTISICVLTALATLFAADAGHRGEDAIQEVWLGPDSQCEEQVHLVESSLTPLEVRASPASAQWYPARWDCESR